jgi:N-acyl homoserine lactone hydrolase
VTTQTDHPKPARPSVSGTSGRPPRCGWPANRAGGRPRLSDPIRQVPVVSTAKAQIRPDHEASSWRPAIGWLPASRRWTGPRPINVYLVHHGDGPVLFDAGQDRASVTDPAHFPGGMTRVPYDRLARFEISPQETLSAGLDRLGYAIGDVRTAVISHLRQDHIGGLAELSQAGIASQTGFACSRPRS